MERPSFDECIQMIRSDNHGVYEDGYHWIQDYLSDYVDNLLNMMLQENDPDISAKFVELLGDSKSLKVIPYLQQELKHSSKEVRFWAYLTLEFFGHSEAGKIAEEFRLSNPQEDFL